MGFLIALFILLLLVLLLSLPLSVEARARIGIRGAIVHAKVYLLGRIQIPLRARLYLLESPYFTLQFGKKRVFLLQKRQKRGASLPDGVRLLRLDARTTVGIEGEPAAAVMTAGAVSVLLSMLIPRIAEGGSVRAGLCKTAMVRLTLRACAVVYPPALLAGIVRDRCIARRKAANTIGKSNEKRTNHASC